MKYSDFKIIDFHCHPFSADSENICVYPKDGCRDFRQFEFHMKQADISVFCGSVISGVGKPVSFDQISIHNRHAMEIAESVSAGGTGLRYIPGIHIHPAFVRESCEELEKYAEKGVKLIGELVPYMMGWDEGYSSDACTEIFRLAGELGMAVSAHPTDDADMTKAAENSPDTTFVFAHPGENGDYMKHIERMEKHQNCCLDICGTGLFRHGMLAYGVNRIGAERLLFGTDFPVCSAALQTAGVMAEQISDYDRSLIFSGNAERLLNIR